MTGFGKGEAENENWKEVAMIRSLNGKGLDVSVRMATYLMPVEPKIKELIKSKLKRGSVHVVVDVESKQVLPPVDTEKLKGNVAMLRDLSKEIGIEPSDDTIFELSWKYSEKTVTEVEEDLKEAVLSAVTVALEELIKSREREGEALKRDLDGRVKRIEELLNKIVERKDEIIEKVKEKVFERAKRLGLPDEHPTVLNEIMFLLERMDVEEEVTRLRTHIKAFKKLLESEGEIGKRLEFLAQEMHREITTLGNKIPGLSEFVVEIKAEIDRIKQQAANVE